jgi:sec-independent protein translocase protein TatA
MEGLFQPMHLLVIFLIALIIFGPKKLPELGKGIGEGFRALKDSMKEPPAAREAAGGSGDREGSSGSDRLSSPKGSADQQSTTRGLSA